MSNLFRTESDVMLATAGQVDDTNDQVQSELNRLRGVVDSVRGSWAGQAQVSFDALMNRWNDSARKLQEALDSISGTEADNAQAFSSVGAGDGAGLAL